MWKNSIRCLFLLMVGVAAQDDCVCAPSGYTMVLNFDATCDSTTVEEDAGIVDQQCQISNLNNTASADLVPVSITRVQFLELNEDRSVAGQTQVLGDFEDGETVEFSSRSATGELVYGIQLNVNGLNSAGDTLGMVAILIFTGDCGVYPVLEDGDSIGWTEFTDLAEPRDELCPASPQTPTDAPTTTPATLPPVDPVTEPPVTPEPTDAPVPFMSMSFSMSMSMSMDMGGVRFLLEELEELDFANDFVSEFGRPLLEENRRTPRLKRLRR